MRKPVENTGFRPPSEHALGNERRTALFAELMATIVLALSTVVAATVLSVGMARAAVADRVIDNEAALFWVALFLGVVFVAMGGLSILPGDKSRYR